MAIIKTYSQVAVGDFVRGHMHRANPNLAQVWRKVTEIGGERIVTVDRNGRERIFKWDTVKHMGMRFKAWQPGDPRADGDNL